MKLFRQILTQNDCCQAGGPLRPAGVMVHSTGADNPRVARYVPGDGVIGLNAGGSHWDRPGLGKCVHAFVGKLADGSVGTVQTLPWDMRGWHAGGSANDTHIGFEICEDGLEDEGYFLAAYREAAELTAMLCREYRLDPLADGVVICHAEGHRRGVASNHADVLHWFPKFGRTMGDFRSDVARLMEEREPPLSYEQFVAYLERYLAQRGALPPSRWAEGPLAEAVALGLTDGSRPQALVTRQEAAIMARAAARI